MTQALEVLYKRSRAFRKSRRAILNFILEEFHHRKIKRFRFLRNDKLDDMNEDDKQKTEGKNLRFYFILYLTF